jgi:rhodanese-related sulfurtransferase
MDTHFDGGIFQTHAAELARRLDHPYPPFAILDVRAEAATARDAIPGSVPWRADRPAGEFPGGTSEATEFFVVGEGPDDPAVRKTILALKGAGARRVVEMTGGMREWRRLGLGPGLLREER